MADDAGGEGGSTRITDEVFMMECLKNATTPVVVDVNAIAKALNWSHPKSVANRVGQLKKKFNLSISSHYGGSPARGTDGAATPTNTPRKRTKSAKQALNTGITESDDPKAQTPLKSAKKPRSRKRKAPDADEGEEIEKPITSKAELKEEDY